MNKYSLFIFLIFPFLSWGQIPFPVYVDPAVGLAIGTGNKELSKAHDSIVSQQSKLQKAQKLVAGGLGLIEIVQKKVYKGLSEVSGTIDNGLQVKHIYEDIKDCVKYSDEVKDIIKRKPQFAIFGAKATQKTIETTVELGSEITSVLTGGVENLMTAGDRYRLLQSIENKTKLLKVYIYSIAYGMRQAERVGFWQSLNPFQSYIDTDKNIVENIIFKYKYAF